MSSHAHSENNQRRPVHKHDGAKHHLITFGLSIILTALAFIAVLFDAVPRGFVGPFIVGLAIVQALFQFFIWMHANQKGHNFPILMVFSGAFVTLLTVIAFIFWLW